MGLFGGGLGIGFEVGRGSIRAACVRLRGGSGVAERLDSEGLPTGALVESFTEPNIADVPAFVKAAAHVVARAGHRGRAVSLSLPDHVARVAMLEFDVLQDKPDETDKVIRWRLKKLVPYEVDGAELRHQYLGRFREGDADKHRYLVTVMMPAVLGQYEQAFREAGVKVSRVGVSTFSVWNLYHGHIMKEAGQLSAALMDLSGGKMALLVAAGGVPRFFRLKDLGAGGAEPGKVMRELDASLTFYRENYGGQPVERVFVAGDAEGLDVLAGAVSSGSGLDVRELSLTDAISAAHGVQTGGGSAAYAAACGAALER